MSDERAFEPKDFLFPGQRITLNPDSRHYGALKNINDDVSGYVVNTQYDDAHELAKHLRSGAIDRMQVHIRFDNEVRFDIRIEDLLPVENSIQQVKRYTFDMGQTLYAVNEDIQDEIDRLVFYKERQLLRVKTYDESFKQKVLDEVERLREQPEQDSSPFTF